ncbi:ABC transporter ATP-binding protein [Mucisphaera calidilacus]|nr:ABC transporter ATP-binding protein [Mucisphaera calidilacus]
MTAATDVAQPPRPWERPPTEVVGVTCTAGGQRIRREGGQPLIQLRNVSKSFGALNVLRDLSIEIYEGQSTVIIGPSGTGKSVLLKHIVGLLQPDTGEVWFGGQRVDTMAPEDLVEIRKRIGFLFQMSALFDSLTVGENVAFPLVEHTTLTRPDREERVDRVLRMVGLSGLQAKMPAQLSGGQKKRVSLARSIVLGPEAVMYDEPTTGLDPIRSDLINELIVGLSTRLGITSVIVTHDMVSACKIADRMVLIYDGKIVHDGTPESFWKTDDELVRRFVHGQAEASDLELISKGLDDGEQDRSASKDASSGI